MVMILSSQNIISGKTVGEIILKFTKPTSINRSWDICKVCKDLGTVWYVSVKLNSYYYLFWILRRKNQPILIIIFIFIFIP